MTTLGATFSIMLSTGLKPIIVRYVMFSMNDTIIEEYVKYFTGYADITFNDQSYSTNIAAFPFIDLIGKFPVKSSTYIVSFFGFRVAWYAKRCFFIYCDW